MNDLSPETQMQELNKNFPSARRSLFSKYHIGGCSSCAYDKDETLEQVAKRNDFNVEEAIKYIILSEQHDKAMMLTPQEAQEKIQKGAKILDIRTREEHDAVAIPNSLFMTQDLQQQAFAQWDAQTEIILYDHQGDKALDTAAWFRGHELKNTYIIEGGIDAWSQQIDKNLPRYRMEIT